MVIRLCNQDDLKQLFWCRMLPDTIGRTAVRPYRLQVILIANWNKCTVKQPALIALLHLPDKLLCQLTAGYSQGCILTAALQFNRS